MSDDGFFSSILIEGIYNGGVRMSDQQIIELFFQRDEAAISHLKMTYGQYCHTIAENIL